MITNYDYLWNEKTELTVFLTLATTFGQTGFLVGYQVNSSEHPFPYQVSSGKPAAFPYNCLKLLNQPKKSCSFKFNVLFLLYFCKNRTLNSYIRNLGNRITSFSGVILIEIIWLSVRTQDCNLVSPDTNSNDFSFNSFMIFFSQSYIINIPFWNISEPFLLFVRFKPFSSSLTDQSEP